MTDTPVTTDFSMTTEGTSVVNDDGVVITNVIDEDQVGTGNIQPFLSIQGDNGSVEEGYNTGIEPPGDLPLDTTRYQFTDALKLSDLAVVERDGQFYYRFFLDANESASKSLISLSAFTLYLTDTPDQNGDTLTDVNLVYSLPQDVLVDSTLSSGSGNGFDLAIYVPVSFFDGKDGDYVILYTEFGGAYAGPGSDQNYLAHSGFEEWAASTNDNTFVPAPGIHVEKVTIANGVEIDGTDKTVLVGTEITWQYTVTNTGNVELSDVTLSDDMQGAVVDFTGDSDNDGKLDTGETWVYTLSGVATAHSYTNIGTVTGSYGDTDVSDDDPSGYFGAAPGISIVKETVDDGFAGDDLIIFAGEDIEWRYTVTNTGNVALSGLTLTDDHINSDDIVFADEISGNGDLVFDSGEIWVFTAVGEAIHGEYENTGEVTGSFTDSTGVSKEVSASDASNYTGVTPEISIDKTTSGIAPTVAGGPVGPGDNIAIRAGDTVSWTYVVTNTGDIDLTGVVVEDDKLGILSSHTSSLGNTAEGLDDVLQVGEAWTFTKSGTAILGSYSNLGTATGTATDSAGHEREVTDDDPSSYTGVFVADGRARTQGFWQGVADAWDNTAGQANSTLSKFSSGELRDNNLVCGVVVADNYLDVNPTSGQFLMLGDANGNGRADSGECTLKIDLSVARNILASSTTGDARMIMLAQTIAAQLNIDNGVKQPNDLIKEAVQWLTGKGSWSGLGVNVDTNLDGIVDANATKTGLAAGSISTAGVAWQKLVDVTQQDGTANTFANGEGLKNALMWFNDGHLVTSIPNGTYVGWDADGRGGSSVVTYGELNTPDNFWLTLHNADPAYSLIGIF